MNMKSAARRKPSFGAAFSLEPKNGKIKLDLGCGQNRPNAEQFGTDWIGIDIVRDIGADYAYDLTKFPWPIDDQVVDEIYSAHFFEHMTGPTRVKFMDECWRVMKDNARMVIIVPYGMGVRAVQDPYHEWPPVVEQSFLYFNKGWRVREKLSHYPITCDFDFGYAFILDPEFIPRNDEARQFAARRHLNAVWDLHVTLTRRPAQASS